MSKVQLSNMPMRERMAELAHVQWSGWMRHLFSKCELDEHGNWIIPVEYANNLRRQVNTSYEDLSEAEQTLDLKEADKVLATLVHWFWR